MKTSHLVLALALLGTSAGAAQPAQVSIPRVTTQVAAATVALPIGVFAGVGLGRLTPADSADHQVTQIIGGIAGGVTGAVIGPAIAVRMIGTGGATAFFANFVLPAVGATRASDLSRR